MTYNEVVTEWDQGRDKVFALRFSGGRMMGNLPFPANLVTNMVTSAIGMPNMEAVAFVRIAVVFPFVWKSTVAGFLVKGVENAELGDGVLYGELEHFGPIPQRNQCLETVKLFLEKQGQK